MNNPEFSEFSNDCKEYLKKLYYLCEVSFYRGYRNYYDMQIIKVLLMESLEIVRSELTLLKFLQSLEKYLFYMKFIPPECFNEEFEHKLNFYELTVKIKSGDLTLSGLREKINKVCEKIATSEDINRRIIKYYNRYGFYRSEFLRYFLCEYEVSLMKMSKNSIEKLNRDVLYSDERDSIEHIYPLNARIKYWKEMFADYSQKQRDVMRSSLGNLVAISASKNGKLGNLAFPEKKGNKQNSVGYMYGTYAEIELCNYENWGEKEILDRGIKLTNFIQKRWGIKIGKNKEDVKTFLGMNFEKENKKNSNQEQ